MRLLRFSMLLALFVAGQAWSQDANMPIVRVAVEPATVNVGQALRLRITVLVPTWFTVPPVYPNFELANAVTRLPADSSFPVSERIGRDTWSGIVRDYVIYPQLAARYVMSDQAIRINYMNPAGMQPTTLEAAVPEITFGAGIPSGAEALQPFLGGSMVTLEREIDGKLTELEAGDAIVVRIRATIEGMPAMFLPVLTPDVQQPGLAAYPKEPTVADGKVATRIEEVTYLFQSGGEFTLPALELGWWNVTAQEVEIASVPAVTISVAGAPAAPVVVDSRAAEDFNVVDWRVFVSALIVLGLVVFARSSWQTVQASWQRRREAWHASERFAFRKLTQAVAARDAKATDWWLGAWFERLEGGSAYPLADLQGVFANRSSLVLDINRARYGGDIAATQAATVDESYLQLSRELQHMRTAYFRARHSAAEHRQLPPLNPPVV
ncbi:MAG: hypothetical protein O6766_07910 [Gammaproteobacteria bacterium]|nr:hypothetical protein [Gammaproteobacteria bacterium]